MAYWIPSSVQKRLLRYVLSHSGFLDTSLIDLDNLDISFGRRSVVELRDVGLSIPVRVMLLNIAQEASSDIFSLETLCPPPTSSSAKDRYCASPSTSPYRTGRSLPQRD